jgi:hypothetical protein
LVCIVYPRIQNSGLPPEQLAAVSAAFDEICRLLRLSPTEDALRDLVADVVIDCAKRSVSDLDEMLRCTKEALTTAS